MIVMTLLSSICSYSVLSITSPILPSHLVVSSLVSKQTANTTSDSYFRHQSNMVSHWEEVVSIAEHSNQSAQLPRERIGLRVQVALTVRWVWTPWRLAARLIRDQQSQFALVVVTIPNQQSQVGPVVATILKQEKSVVLAVTRTPR